MLSVSTMQTEYHMNTYENPQLKQTFCAQNIRLDSSSPHDVLHKLDLHCTLCTYMLYEKLHKIIQQLWPDPEGLVSDIFM